MTNIIEVWKPITKHNGKYQVSSTGRIKSKFKIIKTRVHNKGYSVIVIQINKKRHYELVHRLVALEFIPNPLNKPQVNHINGIKHDNRVENLEWVTPLENMCHAVSNGLKSYYCDNHSVAKLSNDEVLEIAKSKLSNRYWADKHKLSMSAIRSIRTGKNWSSLTGIKQKNGIT